MSGPFQYAETSVESGEIVLPFQEAFGDFFPAIIYIYDLNAKRIVYINRKVTDILGHGQEELRKDKDAFARLVYKDDITRVSGALREVHALTNSDTYTYPVRMNHVDGSCRHFKVLNKVINRGEVGMPHYILAIAEDITDQVKREEDVATTHQLFDETEKLLLFGTWNWNAKSNSFTWTDGMYEMLEYSRDEVHEVTNDFFHKHVLPEHVEHLRRVMGDAIAEKRGFELEYAVKTKTGKEKIVYTKGKALLNTEGNLKSILGITRDITTKKIAEKSRERVIRELNRSNKELEEFAYVASHDLHEPLRKILTFTERIKTRFASTMGDDAAVYLERISGSAENMRSLIDNLLEFSKITRSSSTFVTCHLNDILREVISDQELRIEETGTTILLKNLPEAEVVPSEMRQLFNNLIGNALKFRKKDVKPRIVISCKRLTHKEKSDHLLPFDQVFFQINVQDNGIGFESIYGEKIFEIFQRLHGKTEYAGSGIGLAICKKIVDNHEGIIYATSEPGVGSIFSVILPEKQFR